ncbi:MAG: discoidin domain-containing protein [Phycisphaerales bacterium]|nr:MAG: discoidin domain-containing protein [Phycisphaerales bacterium]
MSKNGTYLICFVFSFGLIPLSIGSAADPSLVGWWKLDEASGTFAHDASGRGYDGTLQGGPTWVAGTVDGALAFDGEDDYVEIGRVGIDGTDRRTLTGWARASTAEIPEGTGVFGFLPDGSTDGTYFDVEVDNAGNYVVNVQGWVGVFGPVDTEWHHFVATYEGDGGSWYLDGQLIDVSAGEIGTIDQVRIGANLNTAAHFPGLIDDVRIYNRVLTETEIQAVISGADLGLATDPNPARDAEDIPRDVVLNWTANASAVRHNVYFGTDWGDVNNASTANPMHVLAGQGQTAATFDPEGLLEFNQTYYWRVDGVGADNTVFKGRVWSFTAEPLTYPIENITASSNATSSAGAEPANTINGSGPNESDKHSIESFDMWLGLPNGADPVWIQYAFGRLYELHDMLVWNYNAEFEMLLGFGLKSVTVEYSTDGLNWMALGDVEFAQATAEADYTYNTTVDFGGAVARYVRLTVNSGFGTTPQYGLSEVRFLYVPLHAREPQPADGAVDVDAATTLSWRAGRQASSHQVHLGTDEEAVTTGAALVDTVGQNDYAPGDLQFGSVYYWRVDEVNEAEDVGVWEGDLWSFTVQEYAAIDDFESYTDEEGNRIYEVWIDGWVNGTGSTVGYLEAPFEERTIVHGGRQSMPLAYDNAGAASFSEASRTLTLARDLTVGGANSLRLYFHGDAANAAVPFYLALEDSAGNSAVVTHPDSQAVLATSWQAWTISFSNLAGVNLAAIETVHLGLGNRDNPTPGGAGILYVDDIAFGRAAGPRR